MKTIGSIAIQCLLAVLITVISVLGISSLFELSVLQRRETGRLQSRGSHTTTRLANTLGYTLWNLDRQETRQVVLDEMGSLDVERIQVLDENGNLYFSVA